MKYTPATLEKLLDTQQTALIVYDIQVGILSQLKDCEAELDNAKAVLGAARTARLPIFHTQHISLPTSLMGKFMLRQAMLWQHTEDPDAVTSWFLRGSEAAKISPDFAPADDEMVAQKIGMSAFEGTFLEMALRDVGVCAFLIVGAAMEVGIEPTVRHACDLGFIPIVVEDACAAGHAEAARRSVEGLKFSGDAILTSTAPVVQSLLSLHS
jgi:biuret amidohydrolase